MKLSPIFKYIDIDVYSATPKYLQLSNCIVKAIVDGILKENDVLPSINELSFEFEISRDTAEKGYRYLKKTGIIGSVPGKGYFIKNTDVGHKIKIFFGKISMRPATTALVIGCKLVVSKNALSIYRVINMQVLGQSDS